MRILGIMFTQSGKTIVKFFIWQSIIASIILSVLITVVINAIF